MFGDYTASTHTVDLRRNVLRERTANEAAKATDVVALKRTVEVLRTRVAVLERHQRVINPDAYEHLCRRIERLETAFLEQGLHHHATSGVDGSGAAAASSRTGSPLRRQRGADVNPAASFHISRLQADRHPRYDSESFATSAVMMMSSTDGDTMHHQQQQQQQQQQQDDQPDYHHHHHPAITQLWVEEVCDRANLAIHAACERARAAMGYALKALQTEMRAGQFSTAARHHHGGDVSPVSDDVVSRSNTSGLDDLEGVAAAAVAGSAGVSPVRGVPASANTTVDGRHLMLADLTTTGGANGTTHHAARRRGGAAMFGDADHHLESDHDGVTAGGGALQQRATRGTDTADLPGTTVDDGPEAVAAGLARLETRADDGDWLASRILTFVRAVARAQVTHESVDWKDTVATAGEALITRAVAWYDDRGRPSDGNLVALAREALAGCAVLSLAHLGRRQQQQQGVGGVNAGHAGGRRGVGGQQHPPIPQTIVLAVQTLAAALLTAATVGGHRPDSPIRQALHQGAIGDHQPSADDAGGAGDRGSPVRSSTVARQLAERVSALLPSVAPRNHLRFAGTSTLPHSRPPHAGGAPGGGVARRTASPAAGTTRATTARVATPQQRPRHQDASSSSVRVNAGSTTMRAPSPYRAENFYFTSRSSGAGSGDHPPAAHPQQQPHEGGGGAASSSSRRAGTPNRTSYAAMGHRASY